MKSTKLVSLFIICLLFSTYSSYASFPVEKSENGIVKVAVEKNEIIKSIADDTTKSMSPIAGNKSWVVAILFAFFLGVFGIQSFYLGYQTRGLIQLILGVITLGIVSFLWGWYDLIQILLKNLKPNGGSYY